MSYQPIMPMSRVPPLIDPRTDLILPRGSRESVIDQIDAEYQRLIRRVDDHIDRLIALDDILTAELNNAPRTQSSDSDDETQDETSDDDDYGYYEDPGMVEEDLATELDRRVHFNDQVVEIESDGTVPLMFTPFDVGMNSDSDSDTDTLIFEWDDPCASPDLRFVIRRPRRENEDTI